MKLKNSGLLLPNFVESHEQAGKHPLLLSQETQAKLGFCKDMRGGTLYLKDYDDYIDLYRAKGTGLVVICVSHFPTGDLRTEDFVETVEGSDVHGRIDEHNGTLDRYEEKMKRKSAKILRASSGTRTDPANADCLNVDVLTA